MTKTVICNRNDDGGNERLMRLMASFSYADRGKLQAGYIDVISLALEQNLENQASRSGMAR